MVKVLKTFALIVLLISASYTFAAGNTAISLTLSRTRAERGETVEVRIQTFKDGNPANDIIQAVVLTPTVGTRRLSLIADEVQPGKYRSQLSLSNDAPEGLYVVHAWTGEIANPTSVAKGSFLSGQLINDFFIASYADSAQPADDFEAYLREFKLLGGNLLIAHNLISPTKAHYPSKICKTDVQAGSANDLVELILKRADQEGLAVLLSVSWDMTRQSPYSDRMEEIKGIAKELYQLYRHHPSLAGFYSYQEGSGTYFVPYVREFTRHIKGLNPNLLTACAPHVDDPLLAGYLSTVEELDIMIYQAGVMASYRPDNRKKYPFRRVKDFCGLGAGAKRLQNKIALTHVELFGYLENRLNTQTTATSYENIYAQILSAATVSGADGLSFFTYHAHVYREGKRHPGVERSRDAVVDGVRAFKLISSKISAEPNALSIYFPYSDWVIERWPNYFLPALDAFRILGVSLDILPYAPPLEESFYPYYPFHLNKDVLGRLLKERTVLVLPSVSGFQQTDSDLIKAYVEQGGVLLAFGPQIPMGRSYEREDLFGIIESKQTASHSAVIVREKIGTRTQKGSRFAFGNLPRPEWITKSARPIASFEDGSPAITVNKYGRGKVVTVIPDATLLAQKMPDLMRDLLDHALSLRGGSLVVDVLGMNENSDIAVVKTSHGFRVAVVNHDTNPAELVLKPTGEYVRGDGEWVDMATRINVGKEKFLRLNLEGHQFRAFEFRLLSGSE
jgi:hypothetical protein